MTNKERVKVLLKPREDQIKIYGDWVEIEIQSLDINFSCGLDWWNAEYKEPTTKNDLGVDCISRQAVLDLIADYDLSMGQVVKGIHALPSVTPQLSSGLEKNSKKLEKDFGESDCISRAQAQTEIEMNASRYTIAKERGGMGQVEWSDQLIKVSDAVDIIRNLPSVTPQEPHSFKWCTDCKEYDQEKHCCHRWSKVIRDTVEEMKQEPILDKIRAEIEQSRYGLVNDGLDIALNIIDKYKAETENP